MPQSINMDGKVKLLPYSITELCTIYDVCPRTLKKWIKPFALQIGVKQGRYFTITQVRIIIEKLGLPAEIELDA
jgi:transposase-like protein